MQSFLEIENLPSNPLTLAVNGAMVLRCALRDGAGAPAVTALVGRRSGERLGS
jgi:hypothetical protein